MRGPHRSVLTGAAPEQLPPSLVQKDYDAVRTQR